MEPSKRITVAADVDEALERDPSLKYAPDTCFERVKHKRELRGDLEPIKMGTVLRAFYRKLKKRRC